MKKNTRVFAAGLVLLMLFSFSERPVLKSATINHINKKPPGVLDPKLYTLYIDNQGGTPGNPTKFQKLINSIAAHNNAKLVFQFFYTKNNKLTLIVYSGRKDHSLDFDISLEIKLQIFDQCPPTESIVDQPNGIYLGDLEILNEDGVVLQNLIAAANGPNKNFIVFVPKLHPEHNLRTTIDYTIYTTDALTPENVCGPRLKGLTPVGANTNPSPPHKGNQ